MSKIKTLKRGGMASIRGGLKTIDARPGNFFSDLKEATVELQLNVKEMAVSSRLVTERAVRNIQEKIRS